MGANLETVVAAGPTSAIQISCWASEGVVRVSPAEDDRTPESASSSSIRMSRKRGDADQVVVREGPAPERLSAILLVSGTSRRLSSMLICLRKVSNAPVN